MEMLRFPSFVSVSVSSENLALPLPGLAFISKIVDTQNSYFQINFAPDTSDEDERIAALRN